MTEASREQSFQIIHAEVVTPAGILHDGTVIVENGVITFAGSMNDADERQHLPEEVIHANGSYCLPGFVDIHVHGAMMQDFSSPTKKGLDEITKLHCRHGTTSMLATTMTLPKTVLDEILYEIHQYMESDMPYAQLAGVHLEGPFISPKWPGAQNPHHIVPPNRTWVEEWVNRYPSLIRQVTFAPEQEGALELIAYLRKTGIVAAAGHTDASYEEMLAAFEAGLRHAVHTFNAMTPFHHRNPGVAGAILSSPAISAEIIADGVHVHRAGVVLLANVKTDRNFILITDAMAATGLGDGEYQLGDLPVIVKDSICTLKHNNDTLAGSTSTMIRGFRYLVEEVGLSIERASEAASGNPARVISIDHLTGSIQAGKQADLLLMDRNLQLQQIWVKGRLFRD